MCKEEMYNPFVINDMYDAALYLAKNGELIGCESRAPVVSAPGYPYTLVILVDGMHMVKVSGGKSNQVAVIPWESQLGLALCATVLSDPIRGRLMSGDIVEYVGRKPEMQGKQFVVAFWVDDVSEDEEGTIFEEPHACLFRYIDDADAWYNMDNLVIETRTPTSRVNKIWRRVGHIGDRP